MSVSAIKTIAKGLDDPNTLKAGKAASGTDKAVDLSKGFNIRGPDGTLIPFRPGTPLEKAKEWSKNFYNRQFERKVISETEDESGKLELISFDSKAKTKATRDEGEFEENVSELLVQRDGSEYRVRHAFVSEAERGKGHAAGSYRHLFDIAKAEGRKVSSDSRLAPEAVAIWERFRELGYPIIAYPRTKRTENGVTEWVRAGVEDKREDALDRGLDLPIYEFDPLAGKEPSILRKQAGQTPEDQQTAGGTGMLLKPQAGGKRPAKKGELAPGIYLDEETGEYWKVDDNGNIAPVEVKDGPDKS